MERSPGNDTMTERALLTELSALYNGVLLVSVALLEFHNAEAR